MHFQHLDSEQQWWNDWWGDREEDLWEDGVGHINREHSVECDGEGVGELHLPRALCSRDIADCATEDMLGAKAGVNLREMMLDEGKVCRKCYKILLAAKQGEKEVRKDWTDAALASVATKALLSLHQWPHVLRSTSVCGMREQEAKTRGAKMMARRGVFEALRSRLESNIEWVSTLGDRNPWGYATAVLEQTPSEIAGRLLRDSECQEFDLRLRKIRKEKSDMSALRERNKGVHEKGESLRKKWKGKSSIMQASPWKKQGFAPTFSSLCRPKMGKTCYCPAFFLTCRKTADALKLVACFLPVLK